MVTTTGDTAIETSEEARGRTREDVLNAPLVRPSETGRGDVYAFIVMLTLADWAENW